MGSSNLAIVFAPTLLRSSTDNPQDVLADLPKQTQYAPLWEGGRGLLQPVWGRVGGASFSQFVGGWEGPLSVSLGVTGTFSRLVET